MNMLDDFDGPYPDDEPEIDDSVKFCPGCERPNQFGELCDSCRDDMQFDPLPE